MTKFFGRSHIKIDPKGRLSLPSGFRSGLKSDSFVRITNNSYKGHRFLDFYTESDWRQFEKKVAEWPSLKPEVQAFQRYYLSSVEQCEIDRQGRILIPQHLRDFAQLHDDIVLVGMGKKIEIWNEKKWQDLFAAIEGDYEQISNIIAQLDENTSGSRSKKEPKR